MGKRKSVVKPILFSEESLETTRDLIQTLTEILEEQEKLLEKQELEESRTIKSLRDILDSYKDLSEKVIKSMKSGIKAISNFENHDPEEHIKIEDYRNLIERLDDVGYHLEDMYELYSRLSTKFKFYSIATMIGIDETYEELLDKEVDLF